MTFNDTVRRWATRAFQPLAAVLASWGISANALTLLGFFLTAGVGVVLALGQLRLGGVLIVFSTMFDGLDGLVARTTGRTSRFGAFLDSTLDRYAEIALFFGLFVHYMNQQKHLDTILIFAALAGSLMVSYAKARAEGLDIECKEGLLTRLERLAILVIGLVSGQVRLALWILAVLANLTAVQRMYVVWQKTGRGQV
ncbi:MAG: CDP-alcohol phosphatidyltransferase family protein [Anaerolineae bacterium]|nr:CDP-alcohol phosphatidyltransferase family protein [Anaerolineae bacterium]